MVKWVDGVKTAGADPLVIEEPLEFRIRDQPVAAVMRTPGDDRDLALGFFFGEGWISGPAEVGALSLCAGAGGAGHESSPANVVNLIPGQGVSMDLSRLARLQPATSSCGVCGKRTIEDILRALPPGAALPQPTAGARLRAGALCHLPEELRRRQPLFERTGALHAAGIFTFAGRPLTVKEDIGRHNAVDKAIGPFVRAGSLPLAEHLLVISGRASFEIVQKALRAGIAVVVAVSGVSSLAVDLARTGGMTLCGFARGRSLTCYAHGERIAE
ncbi:MAG: formate dehydrogenase accessory sulfurtransferase FdhD [Planctomycetes bacterium]|nr:formate dehydrogenase accessory sulfurtransferase FdhD [Planctomycetota bacterium]